MIGRLCDEIYFLVYPVQSLDKVWWRFVDSNDFVRHFKQTDEVSRSVGKKDIHRVRFDQVCGKTDRHGTQHLQDTMNVQATEFIKLCGTLLLRTLAATLWGMVRFHYKVAAATLRIKGALQVHRRTYWRGELGDRSTVEETIHYRPFGTKTACQPEAQQYK